MFITLPQADKKDFPLYLRLINEIKSKIHSGEIAAGEKMPSLRKLAHDLDVSRTTAEAAYSQLVAEGYLIASPKRGYFAGSIVSRKPQKVLPPQKPSAAAVRYDFGNNYIDSSLFPSSLWKRLAMPCKIRRYSPVTATRRVSPTCAARLRVTATKRAALSARRNR
mgnify:CR=1 FL=1